MWSLHCGAFAGQLRAEGHKFLYAPTPLFLTLRGLGGIGVEYRMRTQLEQKLVARGLMLSLSCSAG